MSARGGGVRRRFCLLALSEGLARAEHSCLGGLSRRRQGGVARELTGFSPRIRRGFPSGKIAGFFPPQVGGAQLAQAPQQAALARESLPPTLKDLRRGGRAR